jgi:hypothetical protein
VDSRTSNEESVCLQSQKALTEGLMATEETVTSTQDEPLARTDTSGEAVERPDSGSFGEGATAATPKTISTPLLEIADVDLNTSTSIGNSASIQKKRENLN